MRAFLLPLCLFTTLSANTAIAKEIDFAACVGDIRQQALSQGITEQTLVSTLDQAKQRPKAGGSQGDSEGSALDLLGGRNAAKYSS